MQWSLGQQQAMVASAASSAQVAATTMPEQPRSMLAFGNHPCWLLGGGLLPSSWWQM
jgi:hypothetical protein